MYTFKVEEFERENFKGTLEEATLNVRSQQSVDALLIFFKA